MVKKIPTPAWSVANGWHQVHIVQTTDSTKTVAIQYATEGGDKASGIRQISEERGTRLVFWDGREFEETGFYPRFPMTDTTVFMALDPSDGGYNVCVSWGDLKHGAFILLPDTVPDLLGFLREYGVAMLFPTLSMITEVPTDLAVLIAKISRLAAYAK